MILTCPECDTLIAVKKLGVGIAVVACPRCHKKYSIEIRELPGEKVTRHGD
jgi:predicted Zn finger-like uncharacterized protein